MVDCDEVYLERLIPDGEWREGGVSRDVRVKSVDEENGLRCGVQCQEGKVRGVIYFPGHMRTCIEMYSVNDGIKALKDAEDNANTYLYDDDINKYYQKALV